MSILTATHAAAAVKQIDLITIANTWAAGDTATLTMNGKALVVTIGNNNGTTDVATAIKNAWNNNSRLDSEVSGNDATSNFGGQEFGEFAEVNATIDPDSPSVVILTAKKAGVPFTVTAAETTAGTGTATRSSSQTPTGPWHWDNAKNWDTGSVPANDDTVVLKGLSGDNVGFKYGLPNGSLEVTIQHWMSYTGPIGLPPINGAGPLAYPEYRQRYVRLDDAGTGTDIAHRFGIGKDGVGSPLINLKHSTLKCSPIVYNTGSPQISGQKALNLCCTANTSTLTILGGSVDFSSQDGGSTAFATVNQMGGDSRAIGGQISTLANLNGGTAVWGLSSGIAAATVSAGSLRMENHVGGFGSLKIYGGAVDYASSATITALTIDGGTFDCRNASAFTISNGAYHGGKFLDPFGYSSCTAFLFYVDPSPDLQFGANSQAAISIDNT